MSLEIPQNAYVATKYSEEVVCAGGYKYGRGRQFRRVLKTLQLLLLYWFVLRVKLAMTVETMDDRKISATDQRSVTVIQVELLH